MSVERMILDRLDEHSESHKQTLERIHKLDLEIHGLKAHARVWGIVAGAISAMALEAIQLFITMKFR